jgi:ferredoxin
VTDSASPTDAASVPLLVMPKPKLGDLIAALRAAGFQVIGPRVDQNAIVYDEVTSLADLPVGYQDEQSAGRYRIHGDRGDRYFSYVVGPHSWKRYLFPPHLTVARADRSEAGSWQFSEPEDPVTPMALLGVRACELAAIAVQDRVFLEGPYVDPAYQRRRENLLIVAVNCTSAAPTCFCTSMATGPSCRSGFDIALTEIDEAFVVEIGSPRGGQLVADLDLSTAEPGDIEAAELARRQAVEQIERSLPTEGLRDLMLSNLDHPHWDDVASRCLSCANCTMVCPTCFCSSVTEVSDLDANHVDRVRQWESCFNVEFSYTAGGTVHADIRSRYRQWLTHKLASWHDQFGSSGCVGCGRCITWCPVGIDLTEEVAAIRDKPHDRRAVPVAAAGETAICDVPGKS